MKLSSDCIYCGKSMIAVPAVWEGYQCMACLGQPKFFGNKFSSNHNEITEIQFYFKESNKCGYSFINYSVSNKKIYFYKHREPLSVLELDCIINSPEQAKSILSKINTLKAFL